MFSYMTLLPRISKIRAFRRACCKFSIIRLHFKNKINEIKYTCNRLSEVILAAMAQNLSCDSNL